MKRALAGVVALVVLACACEADEATSSVAQHPEHETSEPAVTADCPDPPTKVIEERPVETAYRGPTLDVDAVVGQPKPRLVVQVTNSEPTVERVRLAFDGEDALDLDLPGGADCWGGHNPVFTVAYDRPPGRLEAELDIQGSTSTTTISVPARGIAWAVIDVQSQRTWGDITLYDSRPMWG